jgi:hypothetical protein
MKEAKRIGFKKEKYGYADIIKSYGKNGKLRNTNRRNIMC